MILSGCNPSNTLFVFPPDDNLSDVDSGDEDGPGHFSNLPARMLANTAEFSENGVGQSTESDCEEGECSKTNSVAEREDDATEHTIVSNNEEGEGSNNSSVTASTENDNANNLSKASDNADPVADSRSRSKRNKRNSGSGRTAVPKTKIAKKNAKKSLEKPPKLDKHNKNGARWIKKE